MSVKKALFVNFSNEAFVGLWNSEKYEFGPLGSQTDRMYMEEWKARHFAKHLTNRELLKLGRETDTSPKFPEQNPRFMELFNKAVIVQGEEVSEEKMSSELIDSNKVAAGVTAEVEFPDLKEKPKKVKKLKQPQAAGE